MSVERYKSTSQWKIQMIYFGCLTKKWATFCGWHKFHMPWSAMNFFWSKFYGDWLWQWTGAREHFSKSFPLFKISRSLVLNFLIPLMRVHIADYQIFFCEISKPRGQCKNLDKSKKFWKYFAENQIMKPCLKMYFATLL